MNDYNGVTQVSVDKFFDCMTDHEGWASKEGKFRDKDGNLIGFIESIDERDVVYWLKVEHVFSYNYL